MPGKSIAKRRSLPEEGSPRTKKVKSKKLLIPGDVPSLFPGTSLMEGLLPLYVICVI